MVKCSEALVRIGDLFASFEKVAAFGLKFQLTVDSKVFNLIYVPILSCLKIKAYGKLQIAIESPIDSLVGNSNLAPLLRKV